jgi:hypothetical protein
MRALLLSLLAIAILAVTLLGFAGVLPGGDGIVAQRTLPDGTQLLVTQTHGTADIGYEVGFYFRNPGSDWGWCYLDHEDSEWRNGRIDYDEAAGVATIWKGSILRGRFTPETKRWERPDVGEWSAIAPQASKEPPFMPANSEQSGGGNSAALRVSPKRPDHTMP